MERQQMTDNEFFSKYKIRLNEQQEAALRRVEGATLLLAVPGSGKTTVIIARLGYMIFCAGIPARRILTLTFSLAAAKEMKTRFLTRFGEMNETPHISTIHSFCLSVIRYCQQKYRLSIPSLEPHNEHLIRKAYSTVTSQYPNESAVKEISTAITLVKNCMMDSCAVMELSQDIHCLADTGTDLSALLNAYESLKASRNLMDFDDQLAMAYQMLRDYPEALQHFQNTFSHINVDEAQDTSKIQHAILELLSQRDNNIFLVGDDDQSIYGFRGASPTSLLQFEHTYKDAKVLFMETNYRSDRAIIRQADQFIQDNATRFRKHIVPYSTSEGKIEVVTVFDAADQYERLYEILLADYNAQAGTTAVLYRNNDSMLPLLEFLNQKGLPVRSRNEADAFFINPIIIDILAFLSFAVTQKADHFLRIYFKLQLFINKETAQFAVKESMRSGVPILEVLQDIPSVRKSDHRLKAIQKAFKTIPYQEPYRAIDTVLQAIGYQKYVDEGSEFAQQKVDILKLLSRNHKTLPEFLARMEQWKEYGGAHALQSNSNIILSTLHSSKGLEFDKVIMLDMTDGILPSKFSMRQELGAAYEEEARLFYVGVTRAKHTLIFLETQHMLGRKLAISRFIPRFLRAQPPERKEGEIAYTLSSAKISAFSNADPLGSSIKIGAIIRHKIFGAGVVVKIERNGVVHIRFEKSGVKKLMLKTCMQSSLIRVMP